jgi:hypothetical protein
VRGEGSARRTRGSWPNGAPAAGLGQVPFDITIRANVEHVTDLEAWADVGATRIIVCPSTADQDPFEGLQEFATSRGIAPQV